MTSSLSDGLSTRLCTICLSTVVDDNSRGKAELVCGHLFHLDCIGSEFNYRNEMRCPNCRVVENGEWLIPDEDLEDDEESTLHVINRRLELHIYSHGARSNSPTSRGQQEGRLPILAPTVHYHHNTIVLSPPSDGGSATVAYGNDPQTLLRVYGEPQGSDSIQQSRDDRTALRPNVGSVRSYYPLDLSSENTGVPDSLSSYDDLSLELSLTSNLNEDQSQ